MNIYLPSPAVVGQSSSWEPSDGWYRTSRKEADLRFGM
jgi:hypothetical protein